MINPFLIAVQFLTRLPVKVSGEVGDDDIGKSLLFYPLVGFSIGVILVLVGLLTEGLPLGVRSAVLLAVWVAVTGALHLDGLADSADAWLGGQGDREKTLAIMKDPYCGPAGVVVLTIVLILKFASIESVVAQGEWLYLALIPAVARLSAPLLFLTTPYVREGGIGEIMVEKFPRGSGKAVVAVSSILVLLIAGLAGFWILLASLAVFILLRAIMTSRLGGATGDTAGATIELVEMVALVAVTAI